MKEIAMGVYDATGSSVYEVSDDGKVVIVKAGVFVLEDPHARVKKHIDADPKLVVSRRIAVFTDSDNRYSQPQSLTAALGIILKP